MHRYTLGELSKTVSFLSTTTVEFSETPSTPSSPTNWCPQKRGNWRIVRRSCHWAFFQMTLGLLGVEFWGTSTGAHPVAPNPSHMALGCLWGRAKVTPGLLGVSLLLWTTWGKKRPLSWLLEESANSQMTCPPPSGTHTSNNVKSHPWCDSFIKGVTLVSLQVTPNSFLRAPLGLTPWCHPKCPWRSMCP